VIGTVYYWEMADAILYNLQVDKSFEAKNDKSFSVRKKKS